MDRAVVAIIENPLHGNRRYKHKFGSKRAIDIYLNNPTRIHLKVIDVYPFDKSKDGNLPFTLK